MENGKGRIITPIVAPIIWGSYYVASQKLVGYTSVFTSGVGIRVLTMIFLTALMLRRGELPLLLQTKGGLKRLLVVGTFGFLLDLTAFWGNCYSGES